VALRIVVAEDEALIRMDLVEMLVEAGYEVVGEAGDGEAAVELVRETRPDLVLMDVKMPVLDGISAAAIIGKESLAPVVMLTAFSQKELVERASEAGVLAYVVKPFTSADLSPAIEVAASRWSQLRDRRPGRSLGDPQARRPGQGPADVPTQGERAGCLPVDPEDGHGPPPVDEGSGHPGRGRSARQELTAPGSTPAAAVEPG
jgi:CheY-like chemotaxis protein